MPGVEREVLFSVGILGRFGRLLALVLWVGGVAFFAFVLAPVAFGRLPSAHEAGLVVGAALRILHVLGLVCGGLFVLLTLLETRWSGASRSGVSQRGLLNRRLVIEGVLVFGMLGLTAISQFAVLPRMEVARADAGGDVAVVDRENPARVRFDRLHRLSEQMEGVVLFGGLGLLLMVAGERRASETGTGTGTGTGTLES